MKRLGLDLPVFVLEHHIFVVPIKPSRSNQPDRES